VSQPDLMHSLKKHYEYIKKHEGLEAAIQQLSGERALIAAAERQGRMTDQEAQHMIDVYKAVERSLKEG
jgi:hypothetical protein